MLVFSSALSDVSTTSLPALCASPSCICLFLLMVIFGFLALLLIKQAIFPHWRKCSVQSLGTVLNSHCSQSPSVTQNGAQQISFQLPKSSSILYFCQELLHCYHHVPRSYILIFFHGKRQVSQNLVTFKKQSLIISLLQPGMPRGNLYF